MRAENKKMKAEGSVSCYSSRSVVLGCFYRRQSASIGGEKYRIQESGIRVSHSSSASFAVRGGLEDYVLRGTRTVASGAQKSKSQPRSACITVSRKSFR